VAAAGRQVAVQACGKGRAAAAAAADVANPYPSRPLFSSLPAFLPPRRAGPRLPGPLWVPLAPGRDRPTPSAPSAPLRNHLTFLVLYCFSHVSSVARPSVVAAVTAVAATVATPTPSAGPDLWNRTYYPRAGDTSKDVKPWYLVDADGQTLGRLASSVAQLVRGKHGAAYTPSMNTGSYVVIINAEKVTVSGNKTDDKLYRRHTGRPGSMKTETFKALQARIPERIVEKAIRGMLPSGKLGNELFRQLKVYKGAAHPHEAQQPVDVTAGLGTKTAVPQK